MKATGIVRRIDLHCCRFSLVAESCSNLVGVFVVKYGEVKARKDKL